MQNDVTETETGFKALLRDNGFRATRQRVALLALLRRAEAPLSIRAISQKLKRTADFVTVYRALEALAEKGIVARVDLHHAHAHYELAAGARHHHHITCNSCGAIEDIASCPMPKKIPSANFAAISSHSFELFGLCNTCA